MSTFNLVVGLLKGHRSFVTPAHAGIQADGCSWHELGLDPGMRRDDVKR